MNYVSPALAKVEQVDFSYANEHPNYRAKIDRGQINSGADLEAKEERLEASRLLS